MKWSGEFGPASVLTVIGMLVQIAVVIWVVSSAYTSITKTVEQQGNKIELVEKGSADRFQAVRQSLQKTHDEQAAQNAKVTGIETAVGFISSTVQRLQSKIDGATK